MEAHSVIVLVCVCTILCAHCVTSQLAPAKKGDKRTVVKVATVQSMPLVMPMPNGTLKGIVPDLLKKLEDLTPYKFKLYLTSDKQYGALENGTWSGMMGDVVNGVAELALPLTVTNERTKYVDFTTPLQVVEHAIVVKKPRIFIADVVYKLSLLLTPMTLEVWTVTIIAFFVTSILLYIISTFNPYEWRRMGKDKEATLREAESFTCLNSFWFVISTLAWQGYTRAPRSLGGRIVVTAWWFFVLIFIVTYIASLTNLMRINPTRSTFSEDPFKSFSDFSKSRYDVVMQSGTDTAMGFKNSDDPVYKTIYQKCERFQSKHKPAQSIDEGLRYVRNRRYGSVYVAMVMDSQSASFVTSRKPCDLYMIKEPQTNMFMSIAVAKTSTVLREINEALLLLHGDDTMKSLQRKWDSSLSECEKSEFDTWRNTESGPPFHRITLASFSGAPLILFFGLVLGCCVSVIEVLIYKKTRGSHPVESGVNLNAQNDLASSEHILSDTKTADVAQV